MYVLFRFRITEHKQHIHACMVIRQPLGKKGRCCVGYELLNLGRGGRMMNGFRSDKVRASVMEDSIVR